MADNKPLVKFEIDDQEIELGPEKLCTIVLETVPFDDSVLETYTSGEF